MRRATWKDYRFSPEEHERELVAIVESLAALAAPRPGEIDRVLRRHPKNGRSFFSRSELIAGYRLLAGKYGWPPQGALVERLRLKPVRSLSGVTTVTILTKPFPCPGRCIFCPNDVRMPKSYISSEPGAQRAAHHHFDPYAQTFARLRALDAIGHPTDKVEIIVLGGTWSSYTEQYQRWFLKRAFDALNDFDPEAGVTNEEERGIDFESLRDTVDGRRGGNPYNRIVSDLARRRDPEGVISARESSGWNELRAAQASNETSGARCVGLSLETRPDHVSELEVERLRRLGATKIQIGYQSLDDQVLALNERGHDVSASRRATWLLRRAGFKVQAHWMANLYGSTPQKDVEDFERLFADVDFRPDELKLYPCSLVETAELMSHYEAGRYRPYTEGELLELLVACMAKTPRYCRLTRVIRDIPGEEIFVGSRVTNFRDLAEREMARRGIRSQDIRAREIRDHDVSAYSLRLEEVPYRTSAGEERFLQFVTGEDRIAGFLRLCLPEHEAFIAELGGSAIVREVHVYGGAVGIGEREAGRAQHGGLGRRLLERASAVARARGYPRLSVISSVGTREYYRRCGFFDGDLYQHRML
ncbi:MAG TPA: tRNA uridine(34) 5-carboxymethylaminomethyl modification radical SAM/GNAT enzyme Elp3 [Vicinamibacteria bacterium]|nr:tRNA uridine(34) 5-carboxymethylaminomethyl modification radical SAM/GNAT enzyme Elp3 [Vicinamibacteria bacterium]